MGTVPEHGNFRGVRDLALKMGEWSHAAGQLGEVFARSGCFTLVVEMRCDLVKHAEKLGAAVAEALRQYVDGTCEQA